MFAQLFVSIDKASFLLVPLKSSHQQYEANSVYVPWDYTCRTLLTPLRIKYFNRRKKGLWDTEYCSEIRHGKRDIARTLNDYFVGRF